MQCSRKSTGHTAGEKIPYKEGSVAPLVWGYGSTVVQRLYRQCRENTCCVFLVYSLLDIICQGVL